MLRELRTFAASLSLAWAAWRSPSALLAAEPDAKPSLRVMTYNIWVGGESGGQPLDQTVAVIKAAQPDLVGLQETRGKERNGVRPDAAQAIAKKLSWNYFDQGDSNGVISPHKITGHTPKKLGVQIELPSGERAWIFNVHLAHAPYQPYQLLKIPYADAPFIDAAEEAVAEARKAREESITEMLGELETVRGDETPIFVTGDFNEPSALDWTSEVHRAGRSPVAVRWPTSAAVLDAGFVDAYREVHPDPLQAPGYTWTPITAADDPKDRHDRIDLLMVGGRHGPVQSAEIVGESPEAADIVVAPYPSDHRAVVAEVTLP